MLLKQPYSALNIHLLEKEFSPPIKNDVPGIHAATSPPRLHVIKCCLDETFPVFPGCIYLFVRCASNVICEEKKKENS